MAMSGSMIQVKAFANLSPNVIPAPSTLHRSQLGQAIQVLCQVPTPQIEFVQTFPRVICTLPTKVLHQTLVLRAALVLQAVLDGIGSAGR